MHQTERARKIAGRGPEGKATVMGVLARHGDGRASEMQVAVAETRRKQPGSPFGTRRVRIGTVYRRAEIVQGLDGEFLHQVIDHAEAYVDGQVHTNGCENF
jgi:hypothetical protein